MSKSHLSLNDIFPRLREAVTGRRDNVVHLHPPEAEPLIDDLLDDLDRAKIALLEHVDAIPALRDADPSASRCRAPSATARPSGVGRAQHRHRHADNSPAEHRPRNTDDAGKAAANRRG